MSENVFKQLSSLSRPKLFNHLSGDEGELFGVLIECQQHKDVRKIVQFSYTIQKFTHYQLPITSLI